MPLQLAKIALFLAAFMAVLDNAVVYLALPAIERDLHAGIADQQWTVSIYILMQGSFTLAAGTLGDLFGRKRIFLGGVLLFILASMGCGLAPSVGVLIFARAVQGIGGSVLLSLSLAMVLDLFHDPKLREAGVRGFGNVAGIGAVLAPLVGGACVHFLGWRSIFFVNVPVAIFTIGVTLRLVPESAFERTRKLDVPGQVASIVALLALSFVLTEGNAFGWLSLPIVAAAALCVLSLAAFVQIERTSADPMLRLGYLRDRAFTACNVALVLNGLQYYGMFLVASLFLQNVQGKSAFEAGFYLLPAMLTFFIMNQCSGFLTSRIGLGYSAVVGSAVETLLMGGFLFVGVSTPAVYVALILAVWCLGSAFVYTPATTLGMSRVDAKDAGMVSGILGLSLALGGVLGVGLIGALLSGGMALALRADFAASNVPQIVADAIIAASQHGGAWSAIADGNFGAVPRLTLYGIVDRAFAGGMHLGAAAAVVAGVGGVTYGIWAFRTTRGSRATAAAR